MELYAISPLILLLVAACAFRGMDHLLILMAAMLPFGMLAAIGLPAVGGLSLLAVNLAAAGLVGVGLLLLMTRLLRGAPIPVEPSTFALGFFAAYSVFASTVLVRLFAGETMVFPLARGAQGVRVSTEFAWGKVWLGPTSSNISQTFYIVLGFGLFVAATHVLKQRGASFGERCLVTAASINVVLGVLDAMGLDALLELVRTANYSLANEATVGGIPRVIGGFSEAASFGAASTMFFGYFASSYLASGRPRDAFLALANGTFGAFSLSATGMLSLAVVVLILSARVLTGIGPLAGRMAALVWAVVTIIVAGAASFALIFTEAPTLILAIFDQLILSKSDSSSGAERSAWALGGLETMWDTYGLGAGTGSLRSNGLLFVLLGSVGIFGTLSFVAFLWLAFGGSAQSGNAAILSNARAGAVAVLVSLMLTATIPDPGVSLLLLAALAVSAKGAQTLRLPFPASRSDDGANPRIGSVAPRTD